MSHHHNSTSARGKSSVVHCKSVRFEPATTTGPSSKSVRAAAPFRVGRPCSDETVDFHTDALHRPRIPVDGGGCLDTRDTNTSTTWLLHDGQTPSSSYRSLITRPQNTFVEAGAIAQVVALPREYLEHIEATLVAKHELAERDKEIAMRREQRSLAKSSEATAKSIAVRQRVERRTTARISRTLQKVDAALREMH